MGQKSKSWGYECGDSAGRLNSTMPYMGLRNARGSADKRDPMRLALYFSGSNPF
jgi:hypothetical protein